MNRYRQELKDNEITYQLGIPEHLRMAAVELYDQAFGQKFSVAVGNKEQRLALLRQGFMLDYAIAAIYDNKLIGIAGFQTADSSLTHAINYEMLISHLGLIEGHWATLIFSLYERDFVSGELLMDGIAVHSHYRGQGVGSGLIKELTIYAKEFNYNSIRLDVIDTNSDAKKLYQHLGFNEKTTENFPYLRWLLGFSASTEMALTLS